MNVEPKRLKVAFVYPPYGPPNLANLGLAILAAGVERRGFHTRTFYWNYRLIKALDGPDWEFQQQLYAHLTQRALFPWNEWIFFKMIYPEKLAPLEERALGQLADLDLEAGSKLEGVTPSGLILGLGAKVPALVAEMAADLEPFEVIGISTTFFQNGPALALAKFVKEKWPDKRVVLGGANCDGEMGLALADHFPFVDYVFSGEADHTFPEFMERLEAGAEVAGMPGLIWRDAEGRAVAGPPAEPIADMNTLPIPTFDDFIEERKRFDLYDPETLVLPLESSRGCWWGAKHTCVFCGLNANGIDYRQKDEARFQDEVLEITKKYGTKFLFMADNILSTRYYKTFVAWAKERDLDISFFYEIKANMTRAQVADLADAGITMVQPGIESLSTPILKLMNKGIRGIQNVAFLKYAREYGVAPAWNILAGFPSEDPFEYQRMARDVAKLSHLSPPNSVIDIEFHRFSPIHRDPAKFGVRLIPLYKYDFLYPFAPEEKARHAYVFEVAGRSPRELSYLWPLIAEVKRWMHAFRVEKASLSWTLQGDEILVRDRRVQGRPADYRLAGFAADVLGACDTPLAFDDLLAWDGAENDGSSPVRPTPVRRTTPRPGGRMAPEFRITPAPAPETRIAFTRSEFESDPQAALAPMLEAGLLWRDEDMLMSLATDAAARPYEPGWKLIGI